MHLAFPIFLTLLRAILTHGQCTSNHQESQADLCNSACIISAQCNNQCSNLPTSQFSGCICQASCLCIMRVCQECCTASGGQFNNQFCRSNAGNDLQFCSDPTGPGLNPGQKCSVYAGIPFNANAPFPASIESFLVNIPFPTGIVLSTKDCNAASPSTGQTAATATNSAINAATTLPSSSVVSVISPSTVGRSTTHVATSATSATSATTSSASSSAEAKNDALPSQSFDLASLLATLLTACLTTM